MLPPALPNGLSLKISPTKYLKSNGKYGGRYWDRTSDPCDVNTVLYR
jgi:hypothetical protein